jgi:hypothetical protein
MVVIITGIHRDTFTGEDLTVDFTLTDHTSEGVIIIITSITTGGMVITGITGKTIADK